MMHKAKKNQTDLFFHVKWGNNRPSLQRSHREKRRHDPKHQGLWRRASNVTTTLRNNKYFWPLP